MNNKLTQMMGVATVAMGLLGLASNALADVVVISDTFTLTPTRTALSDLRGTVTEIGNRTWIPAGPAAETATPVFAATGDMVIGTIHSSYTAIVPLSGISSTYTSLQMDINPSGSPWAAAAFAPNSNSMWYSSLALTLDNGGNYNLYANGFATQVATGTASNFTPDAFNTVYIGYYAPSNTVSAWINGTPVVNNASLGSFTPGLDYAGFYFYDGTGKAVDNFQVAIPEPVAASLLLLGLGGLLARRRV